MAVFEKMSNQSMKCFMSNSLWSPYSMYGEKVQIHNLLGALHTIVARSRVHQSVTVPRFFSGTGTGTFFRDQIFPVPGPVLFSGTKFFRYRYRYFFPGPIFSDTGTGTFFRDQFFPVPVRSKKEQNSRDWEFPGSGCHTLAGGTETEEGPVQCAVHWTVSSRLM